MSFDIEGKLHKIFDIQAKSDSFQTRDIILLVQDGNYPQYIKFQLTQDRCGLVERFKPGDEVKISFDLRGREWQGKYFTNLNAWRIELVQSQAEAPMPPADMAPPPDDSDIPTDDLPF